MVQCGFVARGEEAAAQQAKNNAGHEPEGPTRKKARTQEELAQRARRVCIRLASMANRCFWLSATEIAVHVMTDGDCLQSHTNQRIFTRQLQWAVQQCKRGLNREPREETAATATQNVQVVRVEVSVDNGDAPQLAAAAKEKEEEADIEVVSMSTTSSNVSDDYAHRGPALQSMPFYVYRMYVRRVPKRSQEVSHTRFAFSAHYQMSHRYMQEVSLTKVNVPTIDGFQCPTAGNDPEQNSLLKALLFTPWQCTDARIRGGMVVPGLECFVRPPPSPLAPLPPAPHRAAGRDRTGGRLCGRPGGRVGVSGCAGGRARGRARGVACVCLGVDGREGGMIMPRRNDNAN